MKPGIARKEAERAGRDLVTFGTVRKVFERFGNKGQIAFGGGMAAKLLLVQGADLGSYKGGDLDDAYDFWWKNAKSKSLEEESKDLDLYVLSGRPFGKPSLPHEHLRLFFKGSELWIPVEAIYHPAKYFGFRKPNKGDMVEARYDSSLTIPCISPEFYVASILSHVPYKKEKMEMVDKILGAYRCDLRRVIKLLQESPFINLYLKELKNPKGFFAMEFSSDHFLSDLEFRTKAELAKRLPFMLDLDFDIKNLYDALMISQNAVIGMTVEYEKAVGNSGDRLECVLKYFFPEIRRWHSSTNRLKDCMYRLFLGADIGNPSDAKYDYASRAFWYFLQITGARENPDAFEMAGFRIVDESGSLKCNLPNHFFRQVAHDEILTEEIAVFFKLLMDARMLYSPRFNIGLSPSAITNLGIHLAGYLKYCQPFLLSATMEHDFYTVKKALDSGNTGKVDIAYNKLIDDIKNTLEVSLHGGRDVHE